MNLKKTAVLFSLIILIICFPKGVLADNYRQEVSVGLKYGDKAGNSFTASSPGGINVYNAVTGELLYSLAEKEDVYIEMGSTGFASYNKFYAEGVAKISVQSKNSSLIYCDSKPYRGYIYAERRSSGDMVVINKVNTDDYVASVLGKEMSYSWPIEALKAQAVCARNYVLCRGSAHKAYGFDVCTTTHCQVYGGYESEHANTRRAVEETKGVVAKYNGEVVSLFFFATSSGMTESVENVWGSEYGYLKTVADPYENPNQASKYTWSVRMTKSEVEEKLKNAGASIGSLSSIRIDSLTQSGRVTKMTFIGTDGSYSPTLEKCRTVLGLYSQKFTVVSDASSSLMTTAGTASSPYYAINAGGGILPISGFSAIGAGGALNTVVIDANAAENYTFNGGGYGHGVGMSQWGARGMAENGFRYDQILHHYFTNITLE